MRQNTSTSRLLVWLHTTRGGEKRLDGTRDDEEDGGVWEWFTEGRIDAP